MIATTYHPSILTPKGFFKEETGDGKGIETAYEPDFKWTVLNLRSRVSEIYENTEVDWESTLSHWMSMKKKSTTVIVIVIVSVTVIVIVIVIVTVIVIVILCILIVQVH